MMLAKAPFYLLPKELKLAIVDSQRLAGVGSLRQQSVSSQSSGRTAKGNCLKLQTGWSSYSVQVNGPHLHI